MNSNDTIAAIASSSNNGGISVIRISGENSKQIIDKVYKSKSGKKILSEQPSHTIHYGYICDGNQIIDEVMVLLMFAPNSYTREDVVEIDCHGGSLVAKVILEVLLKNGARMAEPGEFTKRAFLNGRIDLSQAEAVLDILNAKNKYALSNSVSLIRGSMKDKITSIRDKMVRDIAYIEAALDDPEHISLDGFCGQLRDSVDNYLEICGQLLKNAENGRVFVEGIRTVIVGKPNVGKSSLMNILLREDRAIVTNIPGTTRDVLEENIRLGDLSLRLIDTAGIHDTDDTVEKIGIDKALSYLEQADFVIAVFDGSSELDEDDKKILESIQNHMGVLLLNKSDLEQKTDIQDFSTLSDKKVLTCSAKEGLGFDELESYIKDLFDQNQISYNDEIIISSMRQKEALMESIQSLNQVLEGIDMGMSEDFLTIDLVNAFEELGKIIGETVEDDIIDTIFREFCMGK